MRIVRIDSAHSPMANKVRIVVLQNHSTQSSPARLSHFSVLIFWVFKAEVVWIYASLAVWRIVAVYEGEPKKCPHQLYQFLAHMICGLSSRHIQNPNVATSVGSQAARKTKFAADRVMLKYGQKPWKTDPLPSANTS